MGKRELVIIIAFIVVGVVAYELTAPPPKEGERGFSISRIFSNIRDEVSSNSASASLTKTGTIALRPGVSEVRLVSLRAVPLTVTGEKRDDIGYEFAIESSGPDEARARKYAEESEVRHEDLGAAESLKIYFPEGGVQHGRLLLKVPAGLLVHLEGGGQATVTGIRAVTLRNLSGEITIADISGEVRGTHRAGELQITRSAAIDLSLVSSRARLAEISGPIKLAARAADCTIAASKGLVEAVTSNGELTITEHAGAIRVSGEGGTLRVALPTQELMVDVRRMVVEATFGPPVAATIITTDEPLRLLFTAPPMVTLDAVATDSGDIRAEQFGLSGTRKDRETRLSHTIGTGGPRILLRNTRGDIVIGLRK